MKKLLHTSFLIFISVLTVSFCTICRSAAEGESISGTQGNWLCEESSQPDAAVDKIQIHCRLETGNFALPVSADTDGPGQIVIAAYNLERGMALDKQIRLFREAPDFKDVEVLLISEADRGCSRTGYKNVARELASALDMNYVYGVEYIELPRKSNMPVMMIDSICEHGNAVLSRFPIIKYEEIRHKNTKDWYIPPGPGRDYHEPRLGGTMAIAADLDIDGAALRVYSMHFDGDLENAWMRESAANELVLHSKEHSGTVVMGGDCNTYMYLNDIQTGGKSDSAVQTFIDAGFLDAHASLPLKKRGTTGKEFGVRGVIDLIFVRGADVVESGVCPGKVCDKLGDHLPIWTRIKSAK